MHDLDWRKGTVRVIEDGEFRIILLVDYDNKQVQPLVITVERID